MIPLCLYINGAAHRIKKKKAPSKILGAFHVYGLRGLFGHFYHFSEDIAALCAFALDLYIGLEDMTGFDLRLQKGRNSLGFDLHAGFGDEGCGGLRLSSNNCEDGRTDGSFLGFLLSTLCGVGLPALLVRLVKSGKPLGGIGLHFIGKGAFGCVLKKFSLRHSGLLFSR